MEPERLKAIELFAPLMESQIDALAELATELDVRSGEHVVEEGDFGAALFAIETGTASVLRDGEQVATLGSGDVFGEIAVVRSGRRIATVQATSDLRLIVLLNRDVWRLERESPATAARLREIVERRAAETLDAA